MAHAKKVHHKEMHHEEKMKGEKHHEGHKMAVKAKIAKHTMKSKGK